MLDDTTDEEISFISPPLVVAIPFMFMFMPTFIPMPMFIPMLTGMLIPRGRFLECCPGAAGRGLIPAGRMRGGLSGFAGSAAACCACGLGAAATGTWEWCCCCWSTCPCAVVAARPWTPWAAAAEKKTGLNRSGCVPNPAAAAATAAAWACAVAWFDAARDAAAGTPAAVVEAAGSRRAFEAAGEGAVGKAVVESAAPGAICWGCIKMYGFGAAVAGAAVAWA